MTKSTPIDSIPPRRSTIRRAVAGLALAIMAVGLASPALAGPKEDAIVERFLDAVRGDEKASKSAVTWIGKKWQDGFEAMLLESVVLARKGDQRTRMIELMASKTGQNFGRDFNAWFEWLWNRPAVEHAAYPAFKSQLYGLIDPKFAGYFDGDLASDVRLDEVRWGGVQQDGIPPLRDPKLLDAKDATYLEDDNVVFAIAINGDARAYPKRIAAWHEMVVDTIGGVPVTAVYCTLCGVMIAYDSRVGGQERYFGTSGFLFRSDKLMYDRDTQSLWNTLLGRPVIGALVEKDLQLERHGVVTTTWGEWRRRHPKTKVLSLDTGHRRDYGEGVAYKEYFATDELMFGVPKLDRRIANKAEILGLVLPDRPDDTVAMTAAFLADNPVYHDRLGETDFVVLTDPSGANRVYEADGTQFASWDGDRTATDQSGGTWTLHEDRLENADGKTLSRLPAQRSFWFGWNAAFETTRLVFKGNAK